MSQEKSLWKVFERYPRRGAQKDGLNYYIALAETGEAAIDAVKEEAGEQRDATWTARSYESRTVHVQSTLVEKKQ